MLLDQPFVGSSSEPQDLSVPNRDDGRRARFTSQEGHLADGLAGACPSDYDVAAVAAVDSYAQTSRDHDIERVGDFLFAEERASAGYA
jgi:hypothetical protein